MKLYLSLCILLVLLSLSSVWTQEESKDNSTAKSPEDAGKGSSADETSEASPKSPEDAGKGSSADETSEASAKSPEDAGKGSSANETPDTSSKIQASPTGENPAPEVQKILLGPAKIRTVNRYGEVEFDNGVVYQISNKMSGGALTVDKEQNITDQPYKDDAGQKWRVRKAFFGHKYQVVPILDETWKLDINPSWIGFFGRMFGFGNHLYWKMVSVGNGAVTVRNYQKPDICLQSEGTGKHVEEHLCNGSSAQQWVFSFA